MFTISSKKLQKVAMAVAATACVAVMSSCSQETDFYDETAVLENNMEIYKQNFVQKYGEVSPTQSWDFTEMPAQARVTRGGTHVPSMTWTLKSGVVTANIVNQDFKKVKDKVADENVKAVAWPYTLAEINLYPYYAHGVGGDKYNYYRLGASYTYNGVTVSDSISTNATNGNWYSIGKFGKDGSNDMNFNSYRIIDTRNMVYADSYTWWVSYQNGSDDNIVEFKRTNLGLCKMFTVNEHGYVAFDCNGDGDYSDLICRIEPKNVDLVPQSTEKRYMVEDLGGTKDFDFNDIVFDVIQQPNGDQKCFVRALGGMLDVAITVGDSTWRKSEKLADYTQIINTNPIVKDMVIDEFKVTGWQSKANNVTVTVYPAVSSARGLSLSFPKDGTIPFMVAVKTSKVWNLEQVSVEDVPGWFADIER